MRELVVRTPGRSALIDVTAEIQAAVRDAGGTEGVCVLFLPHTTAGLTLNENWDPDVRHDILMALRELAPDDPRFRHAEGNSAAHILASLMGHSLTLIVAGGQLQLGQWQGVYLAEFDGPRTRKILLQMIDAARA